ncbi:hypothetical protein Agub_g3479 [Astrephomene gubernaculifera]|uniref:Mitochondrial ribosomal protein L29 n=1 Tax=Astrephomene gubernaculifera TaxID=47775 RepID=A0AAD3DL81_9CHLO|nr:hypothetical protein Agub_g3479 [Astrephomene gubernaculifera]
MQVSRAFTAARPVRTAAAPVPMQRASVIVQFKRTKMADFNGLSNEELLYKSVTLKRELASVKWLQRTRGIVEMKPGDVNQPQPDPEKVPKGHLNKHLRRQIAQCLTLLRERQIADGVTRREALRMERAAALANGNL